MRISCYEFLFLWRACVFGCCGGGGGEHGENGDAGEGGLGALFS